MDNENQKNQSNSFDPFKFESKDISDYTVLVQMAENFGKWLKNEEVKRSQFRRIFNHIKTIKSTIESNKDLEEKTEIPGEILKEILLLKPKLAYTAGRHPNIKGLYNVVVEFVNPMKTVMDFNRFYDFIEATLAYHRFHGGKD